MRWLRQFVPGMLVAATGVGAGDLATSALVGADTGVTLIWAAVLGCSLKWLLSEGIARYQLGTDESVVQAMFSRFPRTLRWALSGYFVVWTFLVGAALMSASGVMLHALWPLIDPARDKLVYGVAASLCGWALARGGGARWFERTMALCTAAMALAVLSGALALLPPGRELLLGLWPSAPRDPDQRANVIALMGGIGGTVTLLCYGPWIAAQGRRDASALATCRIDLAAAYAMTALFGIGMLVIGRGLSFHGDGGGATLAVAISDRLTAALGPTAGWLFRIGAFAAVFSSLLGVWHSVPLLCADAARAWRGHSSGDLTTSAAYRHCQTALALVPIAGLWVGFARMQKAYAVAGSLFTPLLAAVLLWLLRQRRLAGLRIGWLHASLLLAACAFYAIELTDTALRS